MNKPTRRSFLKQGALLGATAVFSARSWGQVPGANDDVRVAVVGLNGRGKNHLATLARIPGVRIVAVCDVDSAVLDATAARLADEGRPVDKHADLRRLLASPGVDAITIATPNHWHALSGIWACQAGKDVYVEKPVSHNVWEGRQLVAAAARFNRVMQAGTQIRSGEGLIEAVAWVRAGNLGRVKASRGFCYKRRKSIGRTEGPQEVPAGVDYDLWCGPAPKAPLRRAQFHYDWHWQFPTGNGDLGNQGIHQVDVARWFLGEPGLPRHVLSVGGRLGYEDDGDTPNTQVVIYDYATAPLVFEVRGLPARPEAAAGGGGDGDDAAPTMDQYQGVSIGNVVECEGGRVVTNSYFSAAAYDRDGVLLKQFKGTDRHMANFIDVVRSRRNADLHGPIGEGHVSSALCHLGNISLQLGRGVPAGELREKIMGDAAMAEACGRMVEHLAVNGVDLVRTPLTLGLPLPIGAGTERFTGGNAAAANALLSREYRRPFEVPRMVP